MHIRMPILCYVLSLQQTLEKSMTAAKVIIESLKCLSIRPLSTWYVLLRIRFHVCHAILESKRERPRSIVPSYILFSSNYLCLQPLVPLPSIMRPTARKVESKWRIWPSTKSAFSHLRTPYYILFQREGNKYRNGDFHTKVDNIMYGSEQMCKI